MRIKIVVIFLLSLCLSCNSIIIESIVDGSFITPPAVLNCNIKNNAVNVATDVQIHLTFSSSMAIETLEEAIQIYDYLSNPIPFSLELDSVKAVLTIEFLDVLETNSSYRLVVDQNAKSQSGQPLRNIYEISFTTSSFSARPTITVLSPEDGSIDISRNTSILFTSSLAMDYDSLLLNTSLFDESNQPVQFELTELKTNVYLANPIDELQPLIEYTLEITSQAYAINGITLNGNVMSSFTTRKESDYTPPEGVQNITQHRLEKNKARISWIPPDLNRSANVDVEGFVVVKTMDVVFNGTLGREPYLTGRLIGNGSVVKILNRESTYFIDNDLDEAFQYQYTVFVMDDSYNYSTPESTPLLVDFISTTATDIFHEVDISWEIDRACAFQIGYHFDLDLEFEESYKNPSSPIANSTNGNVTITELIPVLPYYFGLEAVDNHGNVLKINSFMDQYATESYSDYSSYFTYLTDGDANVTYPHVLSNGQKVVFSTDADNFLGSHENSGFEQIAEWDLATGDVTYITDGDERSNLPKYSPDGKKIVFSTNADNFLGSHENNGIIYQIAEWDRTTGDTTYITDGEDSSGGANYNHDASKIVFMTNADSFLGSHLYSDEYQVAEWDRATGDITYITDGNDFNRDATYNPDGQRIVIYTDADNYLGNRPYDSRQIAEWNRVTGEIHYLTTGDGLNETPVYSPDGNRVVFETHAANYLGERGSDQLQIAEWDRSTNEVWYVTNGNDDSRRPSYHPSGDKILFTTYASNFWGPPPIGFWRSLAEWDRHTKQITYITSEPDGAADYGTYIGTGDEVLFTSRSDNYTGVIVNTFPDQLIRWVRP